MESVWTLEGTGVVYGEHVFYDFDKAWRVAESLSTDCVVVPLIFLNN